jgi:hypothetical protein
MIDAKFMLNVNTPEVNNKIQSLANKRCLTDDEVLQMNTDVVNTHREVADRAIPTRTVAARTPPGKKK